MFLYSRGINNNFSFLAAQHYKGLRDDYKLKSGEIKYYKSSIISKVDKERRARGKSATFFEDLFQDNYYLLERIIVAEPNELAEIVDSVNANILFGRYPEIIRSTTKGDVLTSFGQKIKNVFDYSSFITKSSRKKNDKWDAYSLADELGIDVCAYCNRNFTFTLIAGKKKIVRPEFDHFLPKSKFPYLALSFYNLIPSCHICNSNLKHDIDFNLKDYLHPYVSCFDDVMRFSVQLKSKPTADLIKEKNSFGLAFFYGDLKSFDLVFKGNPSVLQSELDKAQKNIEVFKLDELYNKHKDLVIEMVQNSIIYDESYIDSLFKKFEGTLFRSREDVLRHITKNYTTNTDAPKRSFSKLSRDIHREFGLKY
jgi:hypothetical protein